MMSKEKAEQSINSEKTATEPESHWVPQSSGGGLSWVSHHSIGPMTPLFPVLFVHTGTEQAPFSERKASQASFPHYQLLIAFSLSPHFKETILYWFLCFLKMLSFPIHTHNLQSLLRSATCWVLLSSNITSSERSSLNHYVKLSLETKPDA